MQTTQPLPSQRPTSPQKSIVATHGRSKTESSKLLTSISHSPQPSHQTTHQHKHQRGVSFAVGEGDCKAYSTIQFTDQQPVTTPKQKINVTNDNTIIASASTTVATATVVNTDRFAPNKRGIYGISRSVVNEWIDDANQWNSLLT